MQQIADDLYTHRDTVADRINLWLAGESLVKRGNKGCLHQDRQNSTLVLNVIAAAVKENETIYIDELADIVEEQTGVAKCEKHMQGSVRAEAHSQEGNCLVSCLALASAASRKRCSFGCFQRNLTLIITYLFTAGVASIRSP